MKRKYEYKTVNGILKGITITSTEHIKSDSWDKEWLDAIYIELLLNIDEQWKTARQLIKYMSPYLRETLTTPQIRQVLTFLKRKGLVEYQKINRTHSQYRRAQKIPKHMGRNG